MAFTYLRENDEWTSRPCVFTWKPKTYAALYPKPIDCHQWRGVPVSHIRLGVMILHLNPHRAHRLLAATRRQLRAAA